MELRWNLLPAFFVQRSRHRSVKTHVNFVRLSLQDGPWPAAVNALIPLHTAVQPTTPGLVRTAHVFLAANYPWTSAHVDIAAIYPWTSAHVYLAANYPWTSAHVL
jgi:hypothetical protein